MKVRYGANIIDVFYGLLYFGWRTRVGRMSLLVIVIVNAVITLPTLLSYDNIYDAVAYMIVVCGPAFGVMIVFLVIGSIAIYFGNRKIYQDMTLQLSDAGIVHTARGIRSEFEWSSLERIVATRRLIVLRISDAAALSVPRRAFTTEAEATQFIEYASSRMSRG